MFKGRCFPKEIILQAVYFKLRFSLSYRDIEELLSIRGIMVDYATIQRWAFKFTPLKVINIDQSGANKEAIKTYNKRCIKSIRIRQCKYLNNRVEGDHRFIKWRTQNMLGFKSFESTSRTLSGIEMVRMIKKQQLLIDATEPTKAILKKSSRV
jgi:transposase-like protein